MLNDTYQYTSVMVHVDVWILNHFFKTFFSGSRIFLNRTSTRKVIRLPEIFKTEIFALPQFSLLNFFFQKKNYFFMSQKLSKKITRIKSLSPSPENQFSNFHLNFPHSPKNHCASSFTVKLQITQKSSTKNYILKIFFFSFSSFLDVFAILTVS